MTDRANLFVIAAPSGAGKTSLVRGLTETLRDVEVSISYTTRPARPGEIDGQDYYFVAPDSFEALIESDQLLEYAKVLNRGDYYGTGRGPVFDRLQAGIDVILEIDWQGARQVKERVRDCIGIFIMPPSKNALLERLRNRGQDSESVIAQRMDQAVHEMAHFSEFDYLIVNDHFDDALEALRAIFIAQRCCLERQNQTRADLLASLLSSTQ